MNIFAKFSPINLRLRKRSGVTAKNAVANDPEFNARKPNLNLRTTGCSTTSTSSTVSSISQCDMIDNVFTSINLEDMDHCLLHRLSSSDNSLVLETPQQNIELEDDIDDLDNDSDDDDDDDDDEMTISSAMDSSFYIPEERDTLEKQDEVLEHSIRMSRIGSIDSASTDEGSVLDYQEHCDIDCVENQCGNESAKDYSPQFPFDKPAMLKELNFGVDEVRLQPRRSIVNYMINTTRISYPRHKIINPFDSNVMKTINSSRLIETNCAKFTQAMSRFREQRKHISIPKGFFV